MKTTRREFLVDALKWTGALVLGGCNRRGRPKKVAAPRIAPPKKSGFSRLRLYIDIRLRGLIFHTRFN